ncbi:alcohol dehydrogenase catalytic domain-containing protein [Mycobacterium sp. CBMA271]|uniref:alcohol dehydrogenase catalytic domain-containing protein n=1 Tax=unclassified Mycobacteroides TaxID=2618759 RepID=UPI0012DEB8BF|nr:MULTISPECIES: alcohol dehydrogenase catalytic domain-containing protein [unclassified Mycobacteroides]MUM17860.1 alcohol dehydrogenase [Mycobacteroides sp. CBMA 326]MUM20431.1 alcohol dehydrogenase catalytic domain-containing protein [Mycobacteroides sp. CBMA 271]
MSESVMRAVQAVAAGAPFVVGKIPVPEPGPGQVRIRVRACGVCGGENIARNGLLGVIFPRVPGHEIAGVIDAVGDRLTGWRQGERVGVGWQGGYCRQCQWCRAGDFANCAHAQVVGASYDGGYAEYLVAPQEAVARIPDELSFEEAAPLMCAGITTFNALRHSGAGPGDTVAIQGIGGLGHLAVQFADKMGFRTVAINRGHNKARLARQLGADEYIDSTDGSAGEALSRLGGAATILSTAGVADAQVDLIQGLRPNGRLMVIATDHAPLQFSADQLVFGRRSVIGWYSGHAKDSEDTLDFAVLKGIRPLIETHPLETAETTFQDMSNARYRAVLTP